MTTWLCLSMRSKACHSFALLPLTQPSLHWYLAIVCNVSNLSRTFHDPGEPADQDDALLFEAKQEGARLAEAAERDGTRRARDSSPARRLPPSFASSPLPDKALKKLSIGACDLKSPRSASALPPKTGKKGKKIFDADE